MDDLKIITMCDIETEKISWLWKPYIPFGKITIVQGDPGDGKTTMMLSIAAAVTKGEALPGMDFDTVPVPANIIYQSAEDGLADTIKPRLEQLGADCGRVHVIDEGERSLSLSDDRIEQAILETEAKLFIIDPLQAYLGGSDMHSAHGIRPLMKSLGSIAERTGCAIVIIGHLNKKGGKSAYRGLGSIDIYAAARSVLTIGRVDENTRAVVHNKSNLTPSGVSLTFGFDPDDGFVWQGEHDIGIDDLLKGKVGKSESRLEQAMEFIKNELADRSVAAIEIIESAEGLGISLKTLKRAKSALGVVSVKRNGQWFWELPIAAVYVEAGEQEGQNSCMSFLTPMTPLPIFEGVEKAS